MNQQRDISRVLDAWFSDGPSAMPDRLFDGVLDEVGRMPQRRRPWAPLRDRPMTLPVRLAAAAAVLVVLGAGFVLVGLPADDPQVGNTPAPSGTPAAVAPSAGADVPQALRFDFIGEPRLLAAPAVPDESVIKFTGRTFRYDETFLESSAGAPSPGIVRLVSTSTTGGCAVGDIGDYRWTLSPGGTRLSLALVDDACAARAGVVAGDWLRAACPSTNVSDLCLGELEAGEYTTQYFDPFQAPSLLDRWRARFGALQYTVPAGWINLEDHPWNYHLLRRGDPLQTGVFLFGDVRLRTETDNCSEAQDPELGWSASEIRDYLVTADGIVASAPRDIRFGGIEGLTGWQIDIEMDPEWTAACPWSEGKPYRGIFVDSNPAPNGFAWGLNQMTHMRLFLLDIGDGRTLVVDIEAGDEAAWNDLLEDATPVVNSMSFNPL